MKPPALALVPLLLSFASVPGGAADSGGGAPATITKEADLVVLTLKPEAEARLRLQMAEVTKRPVPDTRLFSGEIVTPLGAVGQAVAPLLGGTLDEVLRLADLQAAADGRVLQARVQVDASKIAVERSEKMLSAEAGSMRGVDEAKAALALAEAALTTAQAQRDLLGSPLGQQGKRRTWVRTAIYSGEAALLDPRAPANIRPLAGGTTTIVKPVQGPPTANALTNTVDWYYEVPGDWRAGERVAVEIPTLANSPETLLIPFTAVLTDIHGGQWVYVQSAAHVYTRARIQVRRIAGSDAILASGPPPGTKVVTQGSAELFGTEFFTGK
ncbi:MAG: membrane fusion protein MtrC [Verrucomicrobia bacterium]|nr:membrane fusion protein MtrC [Verrucomicrobiota bacterium]